ncbi:MAG TPA: c-type cytochrome [Flavisolibacter sp.]
MNRRSIIIFILIPLQFVFVSVTGCSDDNLQQQSLSKTLPGVGQTSQTSQFVDSTLFAEGKLLFKLDCQRCHSGRDKMHNHLEGVVNRVGVDYLKLYLTRQDSLIAAKDSNALLIRRVWNSEKIYHTYMYSDHELNAIIEYLK